jgi:quinol monooxygenase YgiN
VNELQGIARCTFYVDGLEDFKRLAAQAMDIVRNEDTGTLQFEISFNDDQSECIVLERYRDSRALIEHAEHFGDSSEAIIRTGSFAGELIGAPSAELRTMLAGGPIRLFTPYLSR